MRHQGSHVPRIAHPNRLLSSSLFASLVARWRKVLFPGPTPQPASASPRVLALLVVLSSVLLYSCLNFRLFEPDEGRYAEIPREMLARGEWIVPLLQGEPYLDKPPLLYWLVMVSYRLCGVHDWAARLVPALAVQGCILLTYLLGRRVLGLRAAWWGALLLLVAPGLMLMGRLLLLDGLLTLWTTLALFSVFEATRGPRLRWGWWLTAALACALGILTKGPIILVLLVPPLCLYHGLTRGGAPVCWRALLAFTALVVLLPLPWFVAMCGRVPDFAYHFFWQHHVVRYADPFDHQRPIWFFLPI
ncbi:MAG: ArnT family glycosyltransferase, partial [Gemmataceae bacterium]